MLHWQFQFVSRQYRQLEIPMRITSVYPVYLNFLTAPVKNLRMFTLIFLPRAFELVLIRCTSTRPSSINSQS